MRKLTKEYWDELVRLPIESLSDRELGQLRRSNRGGSGLAAAVVAEQGRRGLLLPRPSGGGWPKEQVSRLQDMNSTRPATLEVEDLADFHMNLSFLRDRIDQLLSQHGNAEIFTNVDFGPHGEDDPKVRVFIKR